MVAVGFLQERNNKPVLSIDLLIHIFAFDNFLKYPLAQWQFSLNHYSKDFFFSSAITLYFHFGCAVTCLEYTNMYAFSLQQLTHLLT